MTYLEARQKLMELGDDQCSLSETIPQRPLNYCKPSYSVTIFHREAVIVSGQHSSWKKAVADIEAQIQTADAENGEVAA